MFILPYNPLEFNSVFSLMVKLMYSTHEVIFRKTLPLVGCNDLFILSKTCRKLWRLEEAEYGEYSDFRYRQNAFVGECIVLIKHGFFYYEPVLFRIFTSNWFRNHILLLLIYCFAEQLGPFHAARFVVVVQKILIVPSVIHSYKSMHKSGCVRHSNMCLKSRNPAPTMSIHSRISIYSSKYETAVMWAVHSFSTFIHVLLKS